MRKVSLNEVIAHLDQEIGKAKMRLAELQATRDTLMTLRHDDEIKLDAPAAAPLFTVTKTGASASPSQRDKPKGQKPVFFGPSLTSQLTALFADVEDVIGIREIKAKVQLGGRRVSSVDTTLWDLVRTGRIERLGPGLYRPVRAASLTAVTSEGETDAASAA